MNTKTDDTDGFIDSEAGKIATRYDIPVFKAREIMGHCGQNAECIKNLAEKAQRENPQA